MRAPALEAAARTAAALNWRTAAPISQLAYQEKVRHHLDKLNLASRYSLEKVAAALESRARDLDAHQDIFDLELDPGFFEDIGWPEGMDPGQAGAWPLPLQVLYAVARIRENPDQTLRSISTLTGTLIVSHIPDLDEAVGQMAAVWAIVALFSIFKHHD